MQYLSGYYWRQEESVSLVLKHLVFPGEEPILFGCLCQGEGAVCFSKNLTDWFYDEGLSLCKKASVTAESMQVQLKVPIEKMLEKQPGEKTLLTGAAILCVGEYFALWSSHGQQVYLLNTGFGRSRIRLLARGQGEQFLCGRLQKGVGILVPAEGIGLRLGSEELAQCLKVKELHDEERLEKRLREIGIEAARRGAEHVSTMLVMTC